MEKQLISSGNFSLHFHHCLFLKRSRKTWRKRTSNPVRRVQGPNHLHVSVQWHWVEKEWWELYFECRESQELRDESLARTFDILGSWVGSEVVWKFFLRSKKENWDSAADEMVQRFKETCHPRFQRINALRRGILKQRKGRKAPFSLSWRNPWFNAHHSYTTFFEGTLICKCGKLMKPDQDVMNQIKEAFEILKAPYYRASQTVTRDSECGPNPRKQNHHYARDALRSATKGERALTSIGDRWQNDEIYRKPQLAHNWSDWCVVYLDHVVHFNIYHNAKQPQGGRYVNLLHVRCVDENKQAPPIWQTHIQICDRKRLQNKIDPSLLE